MRPGWRSAILVGAAGAACFIAASATNGDPLFGIEVAGVVLVATWVALAFALILRTAALARALDREAHDVEIAGYMCRVVPGNAPRAFAAGVLRPSIYLTSAAFDMLTPGERAAVVLHEVHHASTLAPVRAALVQAWQCGAWGVPRLQSVLAGRLADIEIEADRFALVAGASRRDLASALVKLDNEAMGLGFSGGGDARVRALLAGSGRRSTVEPVEWLPLLIMIALVVGCRMAGTAAGV